jgi:hypothetical protein
MTPALQADHPAGDPAEHPADHLAGDPADVGDHESAALSMKFPS